jgi:hypothetical protein
MVRLARAKTPPSDFARWPWNRCRYRLTRLGATGELRPYWGRCDLKRDHPGDHALERGFDIVWFSPGEAVPR